MWNMMCDVMPTISEDSISQRSSQFGDDANFEQLMVSMLDERDKLVESLKNEQEKTSELEQKVKEFEKERQSLIRQLNQNLPQVIALKRKENPPPPQLFPPHFCARTHAPLFSPHGGRGS
jgi:septal ring factor EnvC (AmiA/AmiB activator)